MVAVLAYATFSEAPSSAPKTEGAVFGVLEREAQGVGSRVDGFHGGGFRVSAFRIWG